MSEGLNRLAAAAHRELRAQAELAAAKAAKQNALRMIHAEGVPKRRVGAEARSCLQIHGFGLDLISLLALSDASVRLVLDRKDP